MKFLITSGATRENIDSVRFISNISTGATGAHLCNAFLKKRVDVHYVHGHSSALPEIKPTSSHQYLGFQDLDRHLNNQLQNESFDCVIHAAAVSDFSVVRIEQAGVSFGPLTDMKLDSTQGMTLKLNPNPKIISRLKLHSRNPAIIVVGFKLTNTTSKITQEEAVQKLFDGSGVDFVVHNDLSQIDGKKHRGSIYNSKEVIATFATKEEMAEALLKITGVNI